MMVSPSSLDTQTCSLLYPLDNIWQGEIGVRLDNHFPWHVKLLKEMMESICSCFEGVDEVHPVL